MTDGPPTVPDGGAWPPHPGWAPPRHPSATTVLVLGILGLVLCQVMSPLAWYLANQALREVDAQPGTYEGRGELAAGRVLGIIGTALLVLAVVAVVGVLVLAVLGLALAGGPLRQM